MNLYGLCIGGCRDGQWMTGGSPQWSVLEAIAPRMAWPLEPIEPVEYRTSVYTWNPYYMGEDGPDDAIGFWLHSDIQRRHLFRLLVEGYRSGVTRS